MIREVYLDVVRKVSGNRLDQGEEIFTSANVGALTGDIGSNGWGKEDLAGSIKA